MVINSVKNKKNKYGGGKDTKLGYFKPSTLVELRVENSNIKYFSDLNLDVEEVSPTSFKDCKTYRDKFCRLNKNAYEENYDNYNDGKLILLISDIKKLDSFKIKHTETFGLNKNMLLGSRILKITLTKNKGDITSIYFNDKPQSKNVYFFKKKIKDIICELNRSSGYKEKIKEKEKLQKQIKQLKDLRGLKKSLSPIRRKCSEETSNCVETYKDDNDTTYTVTLHLDTNVYWSDILYYQKLLSKFNQSERNTLIKLKESEEFKSIFIYKSRVRAKSADYAEKWSRPKSKKYRRSVRSTSMSSLKAQSLSV